jgi:hypothetical protein
MTEKVNHIQHAQFSVHFIHGLGSFLPVPTLEPFLARRFCPSVYNSRHLLSPMYAIKVKSVTPVSSYASLTRYFCSSGSFVGYSEPCLTVLSLV